MEAGTVFDNDRLLEGGTAIIRTNIAYHGRIAFAVVDCEMYASIADTHQLIGTINLSPTVKTRRGKHAGILPRLARIGRTAVPDACRVVGIRIAIHPKQMDKVAVNLHFHLLWTGATPIRITIGQVHPIAVVAHQRVGHGSCRCRYGIGIRIGRICTLQGGSCLQTYQAK